jgi:hypothetical protein
VLRAHASGDRQARSLGGKFTGQSLDGLGGNA